MDVTTLTEFVTSEQFTTLETSYGQKWEVDLILFKREGEPARGGLAPHYDGVEIGRLIRMHIEEALRWGEPSFALMPDGAMLWLVPVMINAEVPGCVAACMSAARFASGGDSGLFIAVRDAAEELRLLLEHANLTNGPFLELQRDKYHFERRRAEAIHDFKAFSSDFRLLYIREEPTLLNAIRTGDREQSRGILNQILLVLFNQAGENLNLVKSYVLEIITMMSRAAVEAGCDAYQVFGNKFEEFTELSSIEHDHEFSRWLHEIMERLLDAIETSRNKSSIPQLQQALEYMRNNLAEDISREQAAQAAHMSASHFSRRFKKMFNENFSDALNRIRIERAVELLSRTDESLSAIAVDCGFKDQSYFTKIFRKFHNKTPYEYRANLKKTRAIK